MGFASTTGGRGGGGFSRRLARHWRRIALVVAATTGLGLAYARVATPLYEAETRLLVETQASAEAASAANPANADIDRRIQAVLLPDNLLRVATRLGLSQLPEFDAAIAMPVWSRLLVVAGLTPDPNEIPAEERVLEALRAQLSVHGLADSRVIVIEMSSQDRELAAAIPNALAEIYLEGPATIAPAGGAATAGFDKEMADLTARVKDAEVRLAEFRAQPGVLASENKAQRAAQQLSDLADELARLRADRDEAQATALELGAALKRGGSLDALPETASFDLLNRLREQRLQLKANIADLSVTLLDNHPRLRAARAQLADLDRQIRAEGQRVLDALTLQAKAAETRESALVSDIDALKAQSAAADEQSDRLQALEREANALRELLDAYAARAGDGSAGVDQPMPAAHIFARAQTPSEPYFPKALPIAGAAFAASLLVMTLLAFLVELSARRPSESAQADSPREPIEELVMPSVDERIDPVLPDPADAPAEPHLVAEATAGSESAGRRVRRFVKREPIVVPPLASVHEDWERHKPANDETIRPRSSKRSGLLGPIIKSEGNEKMPGIALGEVGIESAAEKLIAGGALRAIFVSPEGDEAAAASILVAREVADAGLRVLLLDLTASGAASWPMLESLSYFGITNLLASESQFTDVIHQDHFSDCHVMPVGTADPARAMRAADRLPIIMESLTTAYDLVVVECGPADAAGIRRLVADKTEIFVSVIDADQEIAAAAAELKAGGHRGLTLVTPAGYRAPNPPVRGRSAA